jgi:hypothetical protein
MKKKAAKKPKVKKKIRKNKPSGKAKYNFGHLRKLDLSEVAAGVPKRL